MRSIACFNVSQQRKRCKYWRTKKKAELLLQFSRMIDRRPYFKIGAERTYNALSCSPVIARSFFFILTTLQCRDVISVFATDSSTSRKEMTLGRDTASALHAYQSARRKGDAIGKNVPVQSQAKS